MQKTSITTARHPQRAFLKDVLICSLGAYGGPEAHMGIFLDQLVVKRRYLTEEELIELMALCSILPGPTSTQTIVAIGHRQGGPALALWTMLVWAVPALLLMTLLSFLYVFLSNHLTSMDLLRFIGPMAVGFILLAAVRIGKKVIVDRPTALLLCLGGVTTYFCRSPWIFPSILILGGLISLLASREEKRWTIARLHPPWRYLILFILFAAGSLGIAMKTDSLIADLFDHFYRYGYLVFGGGQVVVPLMHSELVELKHYMTSAEFLTGYGLVQGLPGPMFSFAAYAGGMAARGGSILQQLAP
ncbi:MAG: chromate transporter, partial [Kiritimatiellaceae bacterium]|nr:chromate transporter [Kiritimatiellaceae bacterium]